MVNTYGEKIAFYKNIINNIQIAIERYKLMRIITSGDYNYCLEGLEKIINLFIK